MLAPVPPAERIPPAAVIAVPMAVAPVVFPEVPGELASVFRNLAAAVGALLAPTVILITLRGCP